MSSDDILWKHCLPNFNKVCKQLGSACQLSEYNYLEVAGLVHLFEYTFELACKTLRDLLDYDGYEEKS